MTGVGVAVVITSVDLAGPPQAGPPLASAPRAPPEHTTALRVRVRRCAESHSNNSDTISLCMRHFKEVHPIPDTPRHLLASVPQVTTAGFLGIMRAKINPIQAFDGRKGRKNECAQGRGVTSRHRRLAVLRGVSRCRRLRLHPVPRGILLRLHRCCPRPPHPHQDRASWSGLERRELVLQSST
jgi:hypothetical protein